ncbi:16S rRNA (cytosine(967)-C(5))-methyltransferase RsmB [Eubacteriales bacterium KG127]
MSNSRNKAFELLMRIERDRAFSNILLKHDENLCIRNEDSSESYSKNFMKAIVLGTLENKFLLDYYIDKYLKQTPPKRGLEIRTILRMGIYQILFMDSGKDYAICNEMVEIAKRNSKGFQGLVNGVLRNIIRDKEMLNPPSGTDSKSLSIRYSFDESIVNLWILSYGIEKTISMLEASNKIAPLIGRVNISLCSRENLIRILNDVGIQIYSLDESPRAILLEDGKATASNAFDDGLFSIQDLSSIKAIDKLEIEKKDIILDMCSAPGGKSVSAAEIAQDGSVLSWDIVEAKIDLIKQYAKRCKINNLNAKCHSALEFRSELVNKFDKVILDPPCSGLGVIRRRPEIKFKSVEFFWELCEQQRAMLDNASRYVKPMGSILYSTCTVNPHENEEIIANFLESDKGKLFSKEYEKQIFQGDGLGDGFFVCILKRRG